ncbi:M20 family metallopeptidase [Mesobacillus foraminis]|uniref:Glutamate carboxypeptidase n=1 Tax=Mesobacillus foraminis TaxID=279826 RepID=A0A4R2B5H1_9BACI|nr:M20 family metallopeptidase [Mesobacillus foraminis]TCN21102.1 glutamate carboxypeptidase [Mesobacillus foraminis]
MEGAGMRVEEVLKQLLEKEQDSLTLMKKFVETESFSHDKDGINKLVGILKKAFEVFPVEIQEVVEQEVGNHLKIEWGQGPRQITILSHLDTVYPRGTLESMPFRFEEGKVYGPGVYDMKASYVMMYHLFNLLEEGSLPVDLKILWLLTSDEEVGSPHGKIHAMEEAARSEAVLVLEPSGHGGALKTARKGGGKFTVEVQGIAAHAGVNPEDGANAIEELCRQLIEITGFAAPSIGTTINIGEIKGGTLFNVVPELASAEVDVRVLEHEEGERVEQAFKNLSSFNTKTRLTVKGSMYRPPMPRSEETERLFHIASQVGKQLGLSLTEVTTGGGSDGNFAASAGAPVLDGLGVVGGYAHSPDEYLWLDSLAERTALLYGIILSLAQNR